MSKWDEEAASVLWRFAPRPTPYCEPRKVELLSEGEGVDGGYRDVASGICVVPAKVWLATRSPLRAADVRTMVRCRHSLVETSVRQAQQGVRFELRCRRCGVVYQGVAG